MATEEQAVATTATEQTARGPAEPTTCPACGRAAASTPLVIREGADPYRLFRCRACRTQFLRPDSSNPAWAGESRYWVKKDYKVDIYGAADVQADYQQRYRDALRRVRGVTPQLRTVLDVGCGTGNFLALAEAEGLTALGADIDSRPVAEARRRGLTAFVTEDMDQHVAKGSVDAVTLWDVIEHVLDPGEFLDSILPKVRPGGVVVIEAPDGTFPLRTVARSLHYVSQGRVPLARRLYYWEHKTYFSPRGLSALLRTRGFETVIVRRLTSPRAKMAHLLEHDAGRARWGVRMWRAAWPIAETTTRLVGAGNKILLVAQAPSSESV